MTPKFNKFFKSITLVSEGMSFYIPELSGEIKNIHDMGWTLNSKLYYFMQKNNITGTTHPQEQVTMDGDQDTDATEGVINFYQQNISFEDAQRCVKFLSYYIGEEAELLNRPYVEKSGLMDGDVWRFKVRIPKRDSPPRLHFSNANAMRIIKDVLGYPDNDYSYSFDPRELLMKIEQIEDNDFVIQKNTREDEQEGNMYSFGLSKDRIKEILNALKELCEWAIENNYSTIAAN
jgi:hypothetical protein